MQSRNFEFLRDRYPELASLGGFAEHYAVSDPASAAIKLRAFAECMVSAVFALQEMPRPYRANLNDLLNDDAFKAATPRVVIDKLHALRIQGNRAAHGAGNELKPHHSMWLLQEAHALGLVAQWRARKPRKHTDRAQKAFFIPVDDIRKNRYDLSINRYKEVAYEEVQYDPPKEILDRLETIEHGILTDIKDLRKMLNKKPPHGGGRNGT